MLPHVPDAPKRVPPFILRISSTSPDRNREHFAGSLASNQTDIYRDKFGWKWKADSEIFQPRIFCP